MYAKIMVSTIKLHNVHRTTPTQSHIVWNWEIMYLLYLVPQALHMVFILVTDTGGDHMLLEVDSQEGVLLSEDGDKPDAGLLVPQEQWQVALTKKGPQLHFLRKA
jgi:hypothetical protein